jgi:hypothetical protein
MDRKGVVRPEGLEPPAYRFEACRSIQLSYGRVEQFYYVRIPVCVGAEKSRLQIDTRLGPVAQLAEQQTLNLRVVGSIPTRLTRNTI